MMHFEKQMAQLKEVSKTTGKRESTSENKWFGLIENTIIYTKTCFIKCLELLHFEKQNQLPNGKHVSKQIAIGRPSWKTN